MKLLLTDRMRDKASTPVLDFGEDVAWYQTGSGAAQDDIFPHEALYVPEDVLLDLKLLEHTLLENASITGGNYNVNKDKYSVVQTTEKLNSNECSEF